MPPPLDKLWVHFQRHADKSCTCKYCGTKFGIGTSVTRLRPHIIKPDGSKGCEKMSETAFIDALSDLDISPSAAQSAAEPAPKQLQQTLTGWLTQSVPEAVARFVYATAQPLSVVQAPSLRNRLKVQRAYKLVKIYAFYAMARSEKRAAARKLAEEQGATVMPRH